MLKLEEEETSIEPLNPQLRVRKARPRAPILYWGGFEEGDERAINYCAIRIFRLSLLDRAHSLCIANAMVRKRLTQSALQIILHLWESGGESDKKPVAYF